MDNQSNNSNPFNIPNSDLELNFDDNSWATNQNLGMSTPLADHRLNDYDNNLFSEGAYKKVDDEMFQLEYKINRLETKIKSITSQIISARAINDTQQLDMLTLKKHQYENELKDLYAKYNNQSLSTKLTGEIVNLVATAPKRSAGYLRKAIDYINSNLFARVSGKFNSKLHIKEALTKLENINKNVDDLVSMQTPYGESSEKYNQLLQYLNTANVIQYQISQMVNEKKK